MFSLVRSLWPHLYPYRWQLLAGGVFILISNVFAIYPASLVRSAFDLVEDLLYARHLVEGSRAETGILPMLGGVVLGFGALVVLMSVIRGVFLFLVRQTIIVSSRKVEYHQKNQLFDHYQNYSLRNLMDYQTGDLMARVSEDVANVRMFTGPGIMYTFNTLTLFVMILVTMVYVNPELTLYVLLPMPLLVLSIYLIHSVIIKRTEEKQQKLSAVSSFTQEAFNGIRLVRAYAREDDLRDRFRNSSEEYRQKSLRLVRVDALFLPLVMVLMGFSTVFVIWIGGSKVIAGAISMGSIAEFIIYLNLLIWPVTALGWVVSLIQKAVASQRRIDELLQVESELQFAQASPELAHGGFELQGVGYTYPGANQPALQGVSVALRPGQVLGIVGPTGSGKSTLARLLTRLVDRSEGRLWVGDRPIEDYSKQALRSAVRLVPQDHFLFSDTIAANIAFGKMDATRQEVEAAAQFAQVHNDILQFPNGYDTKVGERGVTLSGGQKQRVAIARAILAQPKILILDDSLSAVDANTEEAILVNLRQLQQQPNPPTVILVTHRLSVVQHADDILVLCRGQVEQHGDHNQLVQQEGLYRRLYNMQQLEAAVN